MIGKNISGGIALAALRDIHECIQSPNTDVQNELKEPEFELLGLKDKIYLCSILSVCFAVNVFFISWVF